jgi:hypothetical protein
MSGFVVSVLDGAGGDYTALCGNSTRKHHGIHR